MIRIKEHNILKVFTIGFVPIAENQRDIQLLMKKQKRSWYRRTLYELFDLIFMRDSTRSWRQKMGAIKLKLRKSITAMKPFAKLIWKTTTSPVTLLHYLKKEKHLTRLPLCTFSPPRFINNVRITICKHWNLSIWNWLWYNWC